MQKLAPLKETEISERLSTLAHWSMEDNSLIAEFVFSDFKLAFAFMTLVAFSAEELQHHPEWSNVWNTVKIKLTTHDAGNSVTSLDIEMAERISDAHRTFLTD
ncbi:MAG: 4a-hydroxytetrahydrobiopterin dehydratase [Pseudomonadales bacterium]